MPQQDEAWLRHQQQRWLRPDAYRWIRPDAARVLPPNSNVVAVHPGLAARRDQRLHDRRIAEAIAREQSVTAELRAELISIEAAIVLRRAARDREDKYSPNQPRVPAGNPDGGQWTDGAASGSTSGGHPGRNVSIAAEVGNLGLFEIKPRDNTIGGVRLAGDLPPGTNLGGPSDEPPKIPPERPRTSAQRTAFARAAASWLARHPGLAGEIYTGTMNNVKWLRDYHDVIQAARDEPKSLEELQANVGLKRPGYDDHHIVEKTWAEYFGFAKSQVNDPSNLASIPRLTHYQITGWYMTKTEEFGGLSPREYLSGKDWDERRRVGLLALVRFKVLKP
jgi:hypothetical protein